jgi:predicted nucleic acid-binding protein
MPHFLDTNILIYSISDNPAEEAKRIRAEALLAHDDGALSVQVLQEFYVQATRSTRPGRLEHGAAAGLIAAWCRFPVQDITLPILTAALEIKAAHGFAYWDSAIIAAARALGCRRLYSEDLAHGREVEGVTIINPFRDNPATQLP